MKKRLILMFTFLLVLSLVLVLTACGDTTSTTSIDTITFLVPLVWEESDDFDWETNKSLETTAGIQLTCNEEYNLYPSNCEGEFKFSCMSPDPGTAVIKCSDGRFISAKFYDNNDNLIRGTELHSRKLVIEKNSAAYVVAELSFNDTIYKAVFLRTFG